MKNKNILKRINSDIEEYKKDLKLSNYSEENNECYIRLKLNNGEIYQPYSNETLIHEDVFNYIENVYHFVRRQNNIHILIDFPEDTSLEEQTKIKRLLRVHYAVMVKKTHNEIHKTTIRGTIILLIGALLFSIFGLLEWFEVNFIFRGIIEIFSWVFIWEACNQYAFKNTENKVSRIKYIKLFDALANE